MLLVCSSVDDSDIVADELQRADSIILTYACDRPETLQNLITFWLPHLRTLQVLISLVLDFIYFIFRKSMFDIYRYLNITNRSKLRL